MLYDYNRVVMAEDSKTPCVVDSYANFSTLHFFLLLLPIKKHEIYEIKERNYPDNIPTSSLEVFFGIWCKTSSWRI